MTPRVALCVSLLLGAAFLCLAIWSLVTADYGTGLLQVFFSAFWLTMAYLANGRTRSAGSVQ